MVLSLPCSLRYQLAFDAALCRDVLAVFMRAPFGGLAAGAARHRLRQPRALQRGERAGRLSQRPGHVAQGAGPYEVGMIKSSPQRIVSEGTNWRFLNELKKELKG